MHAFIRAAAIAALLVSGVAGVSPAMADPSYFHHGRSAPPDFSEVSAYETALADAAQASGAVAAPAATGPTYFHYGRSAPPDFSKVNDYEQAMADAAQARGLATDGTPQIAYNTRGSSATPDFAPVNAYVLRYGTRHGLGESQFASGGKPRDANPDQGTARSLEAGQVGGTPGALLASLSAPREETAR